MSKKALTAGMVVGAAAGLGIYIFFNKAVNAALDEAFDLGHDGSGLDVHPCMKEVRGEDNALIQAARGIPTSTGPAPSAAA